MHFVFGVLSEHLNDGTAVDVGPVSGIGVGGAVFVRVTAAIVVLIAAFTLDARGGITLME